MVLLRLVQHVEVGFFEDALEYAPVQAVDIGPGQLARTHLLHRRLVTRAPGVGERGPVGAHAQFLPKLAAFTRDAAAPVHDRAEYVEGERFDCAQSGLEFLRHWSRP